MPIPAFDSILNVLPAHLGQPTLPTDHSPYPCTTVELCQQLAQTTARKQILAGFLDLRMELRRLGCRGFQWLDGSFVEDIESHQRRDPGDIDVITFLDLPDSDGFVQLISGNVWLRDRGHMKTTYHTDHFFVPLVGTSPRKLVALTRYWYGLFAHRRNDGQWKGMLHVDITDDAADDVAAQSLLAAGGGP